MDNKYIKLRIELDVFVSEHQRMMLMRYGDSKEGRFYRDVIVPNEMLLHNMHYMIQKLFGFKNAHLREFSLNREDYSRLLEDKFDKWLALVNELFIPPMVEFEDIYWDDQAQHSSAFLKVRYRDFKRYNNNLTDDYINGQMNRFLEVVKETTNKTPSELTINEVSELVYFEYADFRTLNEDTTIKKVIEHTDKFTYNYDFGDNWTFTISVLDNFDDIIEKNYISVEEVASAIKFVEEHNYPRCVYVDGMNLLEDVGNLSGLADLLETIYEDEDKEAAKQANVWARTSGYRNVKRAYKNLL